MLHDPALLLFGLSRCLAVSLSPFGFLSPSSPMDQFPGLNFFHLKDLELFLFLSRTTMDKPYQ